MSVTIAHPDIVGRYLVGDRAQFLSVRRSELDRTAFSYARTLASFNIEPGRYVLTISLIQEVIQFAPFEQALTLLGLIGTNADASPFDAGRVESLVRQFDVAAICGLDAGVLDGLAALGHDPAKILAGRIVWARPSAYERVAALPDVIARRCAEIGPILALQCASGEGMHFDGREWIVTDRGGSLGFTSHAARIEPLSDLNTGVHGHLAQRPCACGSPDPRIVLNGV